jgi:hypothetical protein
MPAPSITEKAHNKCLYLLLSTVNILFLIGNNKNNQKLYEK